MLCSVKIRSDLFSSVHDYKKIFSADGRGVGCALNRVSRINTVNMSIERECVRGYHVYKNIWDASIGEELACQREPSNGRHTSLVQFVLS